MLNLVSLVTLNPTKVKAVMATKANIEHFEARRAELEAAAAASLAAAQARAAQSDCIRFCNYRI